MTKSFEKLKHCFTTALILTHFDPNHEYIAETDASDFALGGTLSHIAKDKKLHPNAFHSRKVSPAEINYEIHNKELLAIVDSFKAWRRYLEGPLHMVQVFTDYKNLEYFMTTKVLNRRKACWPRNWLAWTSKFITGKEQVMASQMHYRGTQSTALKRGEVKTG
jgi:hypothetical protein